MKPFFIASFLATISVVCVVFTMLPSVGAHAGHEHQPPDGQTDQNLAPTQESAQQRQERIRGEAEARTTSMSGQTCADAKSRIQQAIPDLATRVSNLENALRRVDTELRTLAEKENIRTATYDSRLDSVDTAQANTSAAVTVVQKYRFEFDCADSNVGERLVRFTIAVEEVREALDVYRDQLLRLSRTMQEATDSAWLHTHRRNIYGNQPIDAPTVYPMVTNGGIYVG